MNKTEAACKKVSKVDEVLSALDELVVEVQDQISGLEINLQNILTPEYDKNAKINEVEKEHSETSTLVKHLLILESKMKKILFTIKDIKCRIEV